MREEFRNCTVLCIAHRLHTIIYYDRLVSLRAAGFAVVVSKATGAMPPVDGSLNYVLDE